MIKPTSTVRLYFIGHTMHCLKLSFHKKRLFDIITLLTCIVSVYLHSNNVQSKFTTHDNLLNMRSHGL